MLNARELLTIGQRVKYFRERRGLSQKGLGELIGRSENWVYKVEHEQIPIDKLSLLFELKRVLRCDLEDLTGGFLSSLGTGLDSEHEHVPEIRSALSLPSSLLPTAMGAVSVQDFKESVDDAWNVYETQAKDRYQDVGGRLPQLLRQGHAAVREASGDDEQVALRQLISLYGLHQIFLRRVGEPTLARVAADRALSLADNTGDPALMAAAAWNLSCVLTSAGEVHDSVELARQTIANCAPTDDSSAEHWSAYGALHLQAAVAAVRATKGPVAWDLYRGAREAAARVGSDRNDWHTCFGPTNVAMHEVHLTAEEGNASEALRLADTVEINPELPLERRTRYLIEVMNCNRIQRDDYATVHVLTKLKAQSPEEIVFSPLVREAVTDLLKREKPLFRDDLRAVATHIGIAA
ncbi:helix-turn-helix domain-containing protein [Streptomyces sp. TRM68367]|uniref:helix-turn-helix domain-containing protein n=1 Tax=Streptomyces sp. TRM68367 TaxID=2758415 RepID=UPI00165B5C6E|nr:helix-turn-helix transcriptional regulator [Streptomyces sp. TRM68367]MBC9724978.1 helix-turn-helix transcriptional regulator [Streptomyces sp. TRM68367]